MNLKSASELANTSRTRLPNEGTPTIAGAQSAARRGDRAAPPYRARRRAAARAFPRRRGDQKLRLARARRGQAKLAHLFASKPALIVYSDMFGPKREQRTPDVHLVHGDVGGQNRRHRAAGGASSSWRVRRSRNSSPLPGRGAGRVRKILSDPIGRVRARLCQRGGQHGRSRLHRVHKDEVAPCGISGRRRWAWTRPIRTGATWRAGY